MNVPMIEMTASKARERLNAYRDGLKRKADVRYERARLAYRELANGRPLVALSELFQRAPADEIGRPRLAIGRADEREVYMTWHYGSVAEFNVRENGRRPGWRTRITVDMGRRSEKYMSGYAMVPMVPPDVKQHHNLSKLHILWEVERWANRSQTAQPDRDPYLIRHITGDLWAVIGEWNLTDVERAIMRELEN